MKAKILIPLIILFVTACNQNENQSKSSIEMMDAFVILEDGLDITTEDFNTKNNQVYDKFEKQYELSKEKVGPWREKALEVQKKANDIYDQLDYLKFLILETAGEDEAIIFKNGKKEIDMIKIKAKDDINVPTEIMITKKNGEEIKRKMDEYREFLIHTVGGYRENDTLIKSLVQFLNTEYYEDPETKEAYPWESYYFEHLPLMAVITIISKLQGDIRNAEFNTINYLFSKINEEDVSLIKN